MIGIYQDVARKTCIATRALPDGRTEYVMQDGGRVDVFTMATKQFLATWKQIEVTKPLPEIIRNMLQVGSSSSMSPRAKEALEAMLPAKVEVPVPFEPTPEPTAPVEVPKRTRRAKVPKPIVAATTDGSLDDIKAWEERETAAIQAEMQGLMAQANMRKIVEEARKEAEARVAALRAELAKFRSELGL